MSSQREEIIAALAALLGAVPGTTFARNDVDMGDYETETSNITLFDGAPESAQPLSGSPSHEMVHVAEADVVIVNQDQAARDSEYDRIIEAMEGLIAADRTLGGRADYAEMRAPGAPSTERIMGADNIKAATVEIALWYVAAKSTG